MLLTEIIRPPIKRKLEGFPRFDPKDMPNRFKEIGGGVGAGIANSTIYLDLKHPNRVLKIVEIVNMNDSYYRYLRMIELYQNNPFFPKIYGLKVYDTPASRDVHGYKTPDHQILYVFMERLRPIHDLPDKRARELLAKIGIEYKGDLRFDFGLRNAFADSERKHLSHSTDVPKFKQAMRLLEPMFNKFVQDMHIENLMVRETPTAYQLVITDPLWPSF